MKSEAPMKEASGKHPHPEYIIKEEQIEAFLDFVEDDDNHTEEKYKDARDLASRIRSRKIELCGEWVYRVSSHSSAPQPAADPTRYMTEDQRKYILSFKEEDPLLMAYVEGQKAAEQWIAGVIAELELRMKNIILSGMEPEKHQRVFDMADGMQEAVILLKKKFPELLRGDGKP